MVTTARDEHMGGEDSLNFLFQRLRFPEECPALYPVSDLLAGRRPQPTWHVPIIRELLRTLPCAELHRPDFLELLDPSKFPFDYDDSSSGDFFASEVINLLQVLL